VRGCTAFFDGDAEILFPNTVSEDFTLSLWLKTAFPGAGTQGNQWYQGSCILDADTANAVSDFGLSLVSHRVVFGVGNPDTSLESIGIVTDDAWHHIAVTRNDTTGDIAIYFDGSVDAQTMAPTGSRSGAPARMLMGSRRLIAEIADLRVYQRVLSAEEIGQVIEAK
jgi:hypothetical protein